MNHTSGMKTLVSTCLLLLAIQGCASLPQGKDSDQSGDAASISEVIYIVKPGDSLSDIALRLTGNINNWKALAEYNDIADPRILAAGETLRIPQHLLVSIHELNKTPSGSDTEQPDWVLVNTSPNGTGGAGNTAATIPAAMAVKRAESALTAEERVKLYAVSVNRQFDLQPFDATKAAKSVAPAREKKTDPSFIKVIGTYFPKGVYEGPGNYTRLLMRVSPGTVFELDREVNDWYKVQTEQGTGYLRRADAIRLKDQSF
ncbi:MAG: LysM peptidoglycan-binding domain-containing protein [Granulosicoccus sp.]|nr:LysM peptidoglycan-binding domain-containing protein [Granulosicoccus sp.]